jgi:hypothetical protein
VTSGNQGNAAATGWDYASGYGSVQIANFSAPSRATPPPARAPTCRRPRRPPRPPPHPSPPPSSLVVNGGFEGSAARGRSARACGARTPRARARSAHGGHGLPVAGRLWLDPYRHARRRRSRSRAGKTRAGAGVLPARRHRREEQDHRHDKLTVSVTSGARRRRWRRTPTWTRPRATCTKTISLNAYIGKPVTLKFTGTEDGSAQTSFVIDDVAVTTN